MPDDFMNLRTGEITKDVTKLTTKRQEDNISDFKIRIKKARKLNKLIAQHCGGFFFYRYDNLLEAANGKTDVAFRFVYLCACATTEGYFIKYNKELCKTIDDFTYIFENTKKSARNYIEQLKECNLIFKDEQGYKLNPMYYYCNLDDEDKKKRSIRTFRECIKELYRNSDPGEHKYMGEILKFVQYINIYNNVLCWYPEEPDKEKIQPLTIQEIRFILRSNSTYGYTLMNKLEDLFVKGEPVFGKFKAANEYHYIINPRLLYRGNEPSQFQALIDQFDISKGQYLNRKENNIKKKNMVKEM